MSRIPEFPETLDERQREIADRIKAGPRGRVRGPLALWLYSPDLAERAQHLGEFLRFGTAFERRISELIILIAARHTACGYVWSIHAPIAIEAGLDKECVEAIRRGGEPRFRHDDEEIAYRFVREVLGQNRVEQSTFDAFAGRFGPRGVVEITAMLGYYSMGAFLVNAVEVPAPDGSTPFSAS